MGEISRNVIRKNMTTLKQFEEGLKEVPATTSWYLSDLGEARGKQELFTRQTPQKLKGASIKETDRLLARFSIKNCGIC